jgi:hypothetical protein
MTAISTVLGMLLNYFIFYVTFVIAAICLIAAGSFLLYHILRLLFKTFVWVFEGYW